MALPGGFRTAFWCFAHDQLPELQRRGLPVARVADAVRYCSQAWEALTEQEKTVYAEKARKWNSKKRAQKMMVLFFLSDVVADIFYFLDIYSYGKLPPHCEQRFLPCEIGCVRYSLQDGIMADFHHFIDPELPPRGFRYHCQAAGDHCELFAVEDLIMKLYQRKYQKEPSKIWVYRKLDVCLWDFSSNTRCKWHEETDIICCALASSKKMGYCISKSFASVYGVPLTAAHLPLQGSDCDQSTNTRIVKLDAGHTQVRFFQLIP
uniref:Protein maelstrom homolog n=1 Tax=Catharus ustulatus TaxID=91951 RepID=A0A8C3TJY9_CATUS